jgi:hypothetical protein
VVTSVDDEAEFELRLLESRESYPARHDRPGFVAADLVAAPTEVYEALTASKGAEAVIDLIPNVGDFEQWLPTAYFSVCGKSGTAHYLDLWDVDHFDGFTDMKHSLDDCVAWFSGDGYAYWGSAETKTGRINCYFTAPQDGFYICNARLQSFPTSSTARVECLIDNNSFGPLTVVGTIDQPHPCNLSQGGHSFRIRQLQGALFFLSLTVWHV